jgi:hypothetical protein
MFISTPSGQKNIRNFLSLKLLWQVGDTAVKTHNNRYMVVFGQSWSFKFGI